MVRAALSALTLVALSACSTDMSSQSDMAGVSDVNPEDAAAYVMMAGASDLYEIQSSQRAVTMAQRPEVRQFAQMLVQHHTQTTQQVVAAARAAGMNPPPPRLMPMQADMIAKLQAAPRAAFDSVYLQQQVPAHEMALALHRNYASNGDTPALRTAASGAVPLVQSHLDEARRLSGG